MPKEKKTLLDFWEEQMKQSHTSSNYFFRKSPSHYHMMLLVMSAFKEGTKLSVEELKTKLFKTSRPKSALIITEACEKGFFKLEKTSTDQRIKNIALCRIDTQYSEPGTEVEVGKIDGHQKRIGAKVVGFPFYDPTKSRVRS